MGSREDSYTAVAICCDFSPRVAILLRFVAICTQHEMSAIRPDFEILYLLSVYRCAIMTLAVCTAAVVLVWFA